MSRFRGFRRASAAGSTVTDICDGQSILEGRQSRFNGPMRSGLERPSASSEQTVDVGRGSRLFVSPSPHPSEQWRPRVCRFVFFTLGVKQYSRPVRALPALVCQNTSDVTSRALWLFFRTCVVSHLSCDEMRPPQRPALACPVPVSAGSRLVLQNSGAEPWLREGGGASGYGALHIND